MSRPVTPWLEIARWLPVNAPLRGALPRTRGQLLAVVAQFDLEHAPRYQPERGLTFCNIASWDITRALGAEIPHWVSPAGDAVTPGKGIELSANLTLDWLQIHGARRNWTPCSRDEAADRAEGGYPTVAVWQNPRPKSPGHIAVVVPSIDAGVLHVAQAGSRCFTSEPIARGFGAAIPIFFTHHP